MHPNYRAAGLEDLPLLLEIEQECFNSYDGFSRATFKRLLTNRNHTIITEILLLEEVPVGYAIYLTRHNSKLIRLYSICIKPAYSSQGLAKRYLEKRLKELTQLYQQITLEVRSSNQRAIGLYKALGFREHQILKSFYADGEDAYNMVKEL